MTTTGATETELDETAGSVTVLADGHELWTYQYGHRRRPCIHPLRTPVGSILTSDAPPDHPWHHGLWFTIKFVNGENFWEEYDEYGVLRHRATPAIAPTGGAGPAITGDLDWIAPDRQTVVIRERRELRHVDVDASSYAIDVDITLVPEVDVTLDRTPFTTWGGYGGLAFRGRPDFHDTEIVLAEGDGTDRVEGVAADWLHLAGTVEGSPAGLAVFDHPGNPSHPVPWYGSTRHDTYAGEDEDAWSNFVNAAFLFHQPLDVAAGEPLRFRYRVLVHDGVLGSDRLSALAAAYRDLGP